jgi:cephalosporin-C deacetylase-like acetyl esterase
MRMSIRCVIHPFGCLLILPAETPADAVTFPGAVAEGYSAVSEVKGDLELPEAKAGGKLPVVLILHGSAGIDGRGEFHGKALNAAGIGTLEIFMFSRGNRPRAGRNENFTHMYDALKYLASRPEIDPGRIGVMGFSWGGGLSLTAASASITQLFTAAGPLCRSCTILSRVAGPT